MDHDDSPSLASSSSGGLGATVEEDFRFVHPAGLSVARHLTKAVIEAMSRKSRDDQDEILRVEEGTDEDVASMNDSMNVLEPEVVDVLQTILAFEEVDQLAGTEDVARRPFAYSMADVLLKNGLPCSNSSVPSLPPLNSTLLTSPPPFQPRSIAQSLSQSSFQTIHSTNDYNRSLQFSAAARSSERSSSTSTPFDLPPPNFLHQRSSNTSSTLSNIGDSHSNPADDKTSSHQSFKAFDLSSPRLPPPNLPSSSPQLPSIPCSNLELPPLDRTPLSQMVGSTHNTTLPSIAQAAEQSNNTPLTQPNDNVKGFLPVNKPTDNSNVKQFASIISNTTATSASSTSSTIKVCELPKSNSFTPIQASASKQSMHFPSSSTEASTSTKQTASERHSLPDTASPTAKSAKSQSTHFFSQTSLDYSLGTYTTTTMKTEKPAGRRRKTKAEGEQENTMKKQKLDKKGRSVRVAEPIEPTEPPLRPARERLTDDLWMRVFEFTPPAFLKKARLVCGSWKAAIDEFDSIFVNCRKENFGFDMPEPPAGMTERQYGDLLGGKGCQEPGCNNRQATRTYWSWSKRWCAECWERSIEREDRILKTRQNQFGRSTVIKMLESIPVAIHDSFVKPHDYTEEVEIRARGPPRLYKCYLIQDVNRIIAEYEALTPPAYQPDPTHTTAQAAAAQAAHKSLMDGLDDKRSEFFAAKKAANDLHMTSVKKIESAIRKKRVEERAPKDKARKARVALFSRRASEECPHIPMEFVKKTKPFKAACRIYRDGGTERGWRALKPKIEKEWNESEENPINCPAGSLPNSLDGAIDDNNSVLDPVEDFDNGHTVTSANVNKSTSQQHGRTAPSVSGNAHDHYPTSNFAGRSSSAMSGPAYLSYNNAYCNQSFNYNNAQPGAGLTQMPRPTLPLPGQLPVGPVHGLSDIRSLPQPLGPFRPHPLQYHQPGFGMNHPYMNMSNGQFPSLRTQIPIGSLLSTPAANQRSNPFE